MRNENSNESRDKMGNDTVKEDLQEFNLNDKVISSGAQWFVHFEGMKGNCMHDKQKSKKLLE